MITKLKRLSDIECIAALIILEEHEESIQQEVGSVEDGPYCGKILLRELSYSMMIRKQLVEMTVEFHPGVLSALSDVLLDASTTRAMADAKDKMRNILFSSDSLASN